jgi:hypothetical protein
MWHVSLTSVRLSVMKDTIYHSNIKLHTLFILLGNVAQSKSALVRVLAECQFYHQFSRD